MAVSVTSIFLFLSTPSARRATCKSTAELPFWKNFYPRPPRGGRPAVAPANVLAETYFYPRPPRGGRRPPVSAELRICQFLSTPSARRATRNSIKASVFSLFLSTPSARRATSCGFVPSRCHWHFYPRPPRGGRLRDLCLEHSIIGFLSTPSARRATQSLR